MTWNVYFSGFSKIKLGLVCNNVEQNETQNDKCSVYEYDVI